VRLQLLLAQQAQQRKQAEFQARVAQIRAQEQLRLQQQQRLARGGPLLLRGAVGSAAAAAAAGMLLPERLTAEQVRPGMFAACCCFMSTVLTL
jgi:hypothetical protein